MKVAFASCSSIDSRGQCQQPIWGIIQKQHPDLLLLLGDNVYIGKKGYTGTVEEKREVLEGKYCKQTNEQHFKDLIRNVEYLAVWDNHDFGLPGHKYKQSNPEAIIYGAEVTDENYRDMVRQLFNQYLKLGSLMPSETGPVYGAIMRENIKFIMLDVRSMQEKPGESASLLGRHQERWLLDELSTNEAEIHVICSGIPYGTDPDKGWQEYKEWLQRFHRRILHVSKPMFIGGNIHSNAFIPHVVTNLDDLHWTPAQLKSRLEDHRLPPDFKFNFMYEAVSSGVGQNFDGDLPDPNAEQDEATAIEDEERVLSGRPRNNYGIIDFTPTKVQISLYGQHRRDLHYVEIDRRDWRVRTHQRMKE